MPSTTATTLESAATIALVSSAPLRSAFVRNWWYHSCVDRIATNAWFSRNPTVSPPPWRQRRTSAATDRASNSPVRASAGSSSSSRAYHTMSGVKKAGMSGARYGCFGRSTTAGGTTSRAQRRRMSFSRNPRSLLRAGSRAANSNSR